MSRVVVGAHVVVYVNGKAYGRCASFEWGSSTPRRALRVVDAEEAAELIQQGGTVDGSMAVYRVHKDGGLEAAGMVARFREQTREKYFSILVLDRYTDTVIFQADRCSVTSQRWSIMRGLVMGHVAWSAIEWNNETEARPDA